MLEAVSTFLPSAWSQSLLFILPSVALLLSILCSILLRSPRVLSSLRRSSSQTTKSASDFPTKPHDPWLGSFAFFRCGLAYLISVREEGGHRGFWIFGHRVLMVRGLEGRDVFFSKILLADGTTPGFDFVAGYRLLNPQFGNILPKTKFNGNGSWVSFMTTFLQPKILERLAPAIAQDVTGSIETWGQSGTVNPFDAFHEIVFIFAMRLTTCTEWCTDKSKMHALMRIFHRIEVGSTPSNLILPWIPTPKRLGRLRAGIELFRMTSDVVNARRREGRREDDPLQALIDRGYSMMEITRFVATALFAAVPNTGNVFSWFLIYVALHPELKQQIQGEVDAFLEAHSTSLPSSSSSHHTLHAICDALTRAGPDALDSATPTLDAALHETLRFRISGFLMRRNMGNAVPLRGTAADIAPGAFLLFPATDLHLDPALYPRPHAFDPTHFAPAAVDARREHGIAFLGWGAARHPCIGRRAALMLMKMFAVGVLGAYETSVVDAQGKEVDAIPASKDDTPFKVTRTKEEILLKYSARK